MTLTFCSRLVIKTASWKSLCKCSLAELAHPGRVLWHIDQAHILKLINAPQGFQVPSSQQKGLFKRWEQATAAESRSAIISKHDSGYLLLPLRVIKLHREKGLTMQCKAYLFKQVSHKHCWYQENWLSILPYSNHASFAYEY